MIFIDCNWTQTHDHLVHKRTLSHLAKLAYFKYDTISLNDWAAFWVLFCAVHLTVCSYHVTYTFQTEYTLYSCLNVKELLVRRPVWINGWVFVYELSGCGFESSCSHLNDKHIRFFTTFDLKSGNHMSKSICNIACSLALLNLWGRSNTLFQTEHTIFWTIILLLCLYNFFASLC